MPVFAYKALDKQGQSQTGTLTAGSRAAAMDLLQTRGQYPVEIAEKQQGQTKQTAESGGAFAFLRQRVSPRQVESFTRELSNLLEAGVPLGRSLQILQRETTHPAAKAMWGSVYHDVAEGRSLAEALSKYPKVFPPVYVAMVRAGETGGFLEVVLSQIAEFTAREQDLKGKVKAALVYPALLAFVATGVVIFLMLYFIPRFKLMFDEFDAPLPILTKGIVAASDGLFRYGWLIAIIGVALFFLGRRLLRSQRGRERFEQGLLRMPALGIIASRFALVRFAHMLGTLVGAGVPLVASLRVAKEAIGYQTLTRTVDNAVDQVQQGEPLARSLSDCPQLFPASVIEMVAVAEETGRLSEELVRMATSYEAELDRRLRLLVSLAEPVLLFLMAAIVGTIIVGMLLPVFTLQQYIQ